MFDAEITEADRERLRHRLDNSVFAKILGGPSGRLEILLRIVGWASMAIAPPWLILFIQLMYLPQQDSVITFWHRTLLILDVLLVVVYVLPWILRRINPFPRRLPSETRIHWAFRILKNSGWPDVIVTSIAMLVSLWIAFFVAVFPWEHAPFLSLTRAWFMAGAHPVRQGPATWFSNRLVLSDQNLIEGIDLTKVEVTRAVRDRSFVAALFDRADLRQIDFTGSNLNLASFGGAKLQKARLACAGFFAGSGYDGCTSLIGANFDSSDLRDASLYGAIMFGASLTYAKLDKASLDRAQLQGATFDGTVLDAANLTFAGLDGASLKNASLIGTTLRSARLRGADFTDAILFGAVLDSALAQNASFEGAQLQGASMSEVHFDGANFTGASVYGTDISRSSFDGARISNLLTSPRWSVYYGYGFTEYFKVVDDPFGKDGDNRNLSRILGYGDTIRDPESPQYFANYAPIPQSESEIFAALFSDGMPPDPLGTELKQRLSRLAPNAPTTDWSKLAEQPASKEDYVISRGERLIIIACAKTGSIFVTNGLLRSQSLCPYRDKVDLVLNSGRRSDGEICENVEGLKASVEQSTICPKP